MRIQRTRQVVAVSATLLCALKIVSALIGLRYLMLQGLNYAAACNAADIMPRQAHGSDWLIAARAFEATGDGRCSALPPGVPV